MHQIAYWTGLLSVCGIFAVHLASPCKNTGDWFGRNLVVILAGSFLFVVFATLLLQG